ncbi:MAG: hypothetical protein KDB79_06155, partial [Acidobacteria bacterium]|nr:hypothetical protein [Acidobacteriota bacterium]
MFFKVLLTFVLFSAASPMYAQSARVKKKTDKEPEPPKKEGAYLPTQVVTPTPVPLPNASATPTPSNKTGDDVISIESALVPIPVSVVDNATGRAITNLTIDDFRLMIDNKEAEIGELFRSESPVRLALLFDNSSSV